MDFSFWLTARVLLYAPSHRQDNTYHSLCYTSQVALAGMRNSSMGKYLDYVKPVLDSDWTPFQALQPVPTTVLSKIMVYAVLSVDIKILHC